VIVAWRKSPALAAVRFLTGATSHCKRCGGHLTSNHPTIGLVDVFSATLPTLEFVPGVHVNYAETVLRIRDGLPKLKDFPTEFGGSGLTVPE
jgi:hypothetical protein